METENYLKLLIDGYFDNANFFSKYIVRKCKEAGTNNIEKEEFFFNCRKIVNWFEIEFGKRLNERERELFQMLNGIEKGTMKMENNTDMSIEQIIIDLRDELNTINRNNFPLNFYHLFKPGYFKFDISTFDYATLQIIQQEINKAEEEINQYQSSKTQPPPQTKPPKEQLTFNNLFQIPYNSDKKQTELKELLKNNEYINDIYQWEGHTTDKKELAFLFHYFKDTPGIMQPGNFAPQIKIFYKEFGLTVTNDPKVKDKVSTVRNLKPYSPSNETYQDFKMKFSEWIK